MDLPPNFSTVLLYWLARETKTKLAKCKHVIITCQNRLQKRKKNKKQHSLKSSRDTFPSLYHEDLFLAYNIITPVIGRGTKSMNQNKGRFAFITHFDVIDIIPSPFPGFVSLFNPWKPIGRVEIKVLQTARSSIGNRAKSICQSWKQG